MGNQDAVSLDDRFIKENGKAAQIAEIIEPSLADLGFRLVRVQLMGRADKQTVQIMAERASGEFTIDDCETISRQISPLLDAFDPIDEAYQLEVSSAGIDRPLVRRSDFEDWAGYEAKIELKDMLDGRRRFRGIIEGFADGEIRLEVDLDQLGQQVLGLPVELVESARLVLTDELVRESLRRSKQAQAEDSSEPEIQSEASALEPASSERED
ncbi:MAG: ribosome maturation factor RimP [Hyphomicrobiaceae bacterium TMED74]|jgi:ribosome maturation factor RimP|nr:ribosome maturation factor RimP [Filomicrobium sp.]RPG40329.1 MAG: ribosome maturation factor RimP [Hyphomicrobiaceae bacterium TMED74]